jgi:hypothetical protein
LITISTTKYEGFAKAKAQRPKPNQIRANSSTGPSPTCSSDGTVFKTIVGKKKWNWRWTVNKLNCSAGINATLLAHLLVPVKLQLSSVSKSLSDLLEVSRLLGHHQLPQSERAMLQP